MGGNSKKLLVNIKTKNRICKQIRFFWVEDGI